MSLAPHQAQSMLDKQIVILDGLRNATTRAVEFREWRQFTLTLIERVWPDQPARAQRFRRVPFSPASSRADDRFSREAFERGCAEARRLLQLWSAEIAAHGLNHEAASSRLADAVRATQDDDTDPEALDFAPVGDLTAGAAADDDDDDDDRDDDPSDSDDESDESEEDDEPVRHAPPQRAPSPAAAQRPPAPPQARAQGTPQPQRPQPAPQPQRPASPLSQRPPSQLPPRPASPPSAQRSGGQRPQPPPARPAAPAAPQRAAEPQRGKGAKGKRGDPLKEMLGLDQPMSDEDIGMPEFESTLGSSRPAAPAGKSASSVPPATRPPEDGAEGEDNPLRRLLDLELEALEQDGMEQHDDEGADPVEEPSGPRLEIENNAFLGHTTGGAASPLAAGGTDDEFHPLDSEHELDSEEQPPARPAAPRASQPDRRALSPQQRPAPSAARPPAPGTRPAPPVQRPAAMDPRSQQRPAPPAPARPAPPPQRAQQQQPPRPAAPQPQAQRPAAPPPPQRPTAQPLRTAAQQPQRPAVQQPQRPMAQPQGQRPGPGAQGPRPVPPPPAGLRPASPGGSKPPARAAGPPPSLEVERFERPEPMPPPERRSSKRRRDDRQVEEEFDDADALAGALGAAALDRVRTEGSDDEDDDYDDAVEGEESDDEDDHRPGLGNVHMVSYVARTFIGLAADVDEMGIPESHQERVRLALLDLAHYLDTGNVTWSILRDAITLVMHYPTLGRQALPLLLPYIETAA